MERFLYSLGIPGVGLISGKKIAEAVEYDMEEFVTILYESESTQEIALALGITDRIAKNIQSYWNLHGSEYEGLEDLFEFSTPEDVVSGNLAAHTVVITGRFEGYMRRELESAIRRMGGAVTSTVTKSATILLVGHKPGGKLKKAEDRGIKIYHGDDALDLLEL